MVNELDVWVRASLNVSILQLYVSYHTTICGLVSCGVNHLIGYNQFALIPFLWVTCTLRKKKTTISLHETCGGLNSPHQLSTAMKSAMHPGERGIGNTKHKTQTNFIH